MKCKQFNCYNGCKFKPCKMNNFTDLALIGPQGPQGIPGPTGPQGEIGLQGIPGERASKANAVKKAKGETAVWH